MLVEVLVLGCEERLDHMPGYHLQGHEQALFDRELREEPAVAGMDARGYRGFVPRELGMVGQVRGELMDDEGRRGGDHECGDEADAPDGEQETFHGGRLRLVCGGIWTAQGI